MTTETEKVRKKSKKEKLQSEDVETGKKRSLEQKDEIKKKFKKQKKAKKDDTASSEQVEEIKKKKIKKQKKAEKDTSLSEQVDEIDWNETDVEKGANNTYKAKEEKTSKRKLKKEKAAKRAAEIKETSKQLTSQKALNYVSKWKHAKSEWKFEKVKQIWLINNLFDENYVADEHYPVILEYFEGCKGLARKQLVDKAMAIVRKLEDSMAKNEDEDEDEEVVETTEYKRARQLLQILPTET